MPPCGWQHKKEDTCATIDYLEPQESIVRHDQNLNNALEGKQIQFQNLGLIKLAVVNQHIHIQPTII